MRPAKHPKLIAVVSLLEREGEEEEASDPEHEGEYVVKFQNVLEPLLLKYKAAELG